MRVAIAAVLACIGCDRVFGLDEVPKPGTITGTHMLRWAQNTASGAAAVIEGHLPPEQVGLAVRKDDGEVPIDVASDGTFSFTVSDVHAPYALVHGPVEYQLDAPTLFLVERVAGYPDRTAAGPGTMVQLALANRPPVIDAEYINSTGQWSSTPIERVENVLDWTMTGAQLAPPALLSAAKHDALSYVGMQRFGAGTPNDRLVISHSATLPDASLAQSTTTTFGATVSAVTTDQCVTFDALRMRELDRLTALAPSEPGGTTATYLQVTPAPDFILVAALALFVENVPTGAPDISGEQIRFGNPYAGTTLYAVMNAFRYRVVNGIYFGTQTLIDVPIDPASGCAPVSLGTAIVAVPTAIAFDGRQLTQDGPVAIDPSHDIVVTWQLSTTGDADFFTVTVNELTATALPRRHTIYTGLHSARVPAQWFEQGHQYVVFVEARLGLPGFAQGDMREAGPIWARGVGHTPVFTPQ